MKWILKISSGLGANIISGLAFTFAIFSYLMDKHQDDQELTEAFRKKVIYEVCQIYLNSNELMYNLEWMNYSILNFMKNKSRKDEYQYAIELSKQNLNNIETLLKNDKYIIQFNDKELQFLNISIGYLKSSQLNIETHLKNELYQPLIMDLTSLIGSQVSLANTLRKIYRINLEKEFISSLAYANESMKESLAKDYSKINSKILPPTLYPDTSKSMKLNFKSH